MYRLLIILLSTCIFSAAFAAKSKIPTVPLYDEPKAAKVVARVPITSSLVPIISKGDWVKVGSRNDGSIGWLNLKQYHKIQTAYYRPNIQSVYVSSEQTKDGKPTVNIIAYRNGKKLTDQEAQTLYKKMLKQSQSEAQWQRENWRHLNHMIRLQQQQLNELFNHDDEGFSPLYLMPGPVILSPEKPEKKPQEKK